MELRVPAATARPRCGFPGGRRESEFGTPEQPEAAPAPGRQREEEEEVQSSLGGPTCHRVGGRGGGASLRDTSIAGLVLAVQLGSG